MRTTSGYAFGRGFWKIVGCVASIGALVAGNGVLLKKLAEVAKNAKGVWRLARKLLVAGKKKKLEILATIFGELTGLKGVVDSC